MTSPAVEFGQKAPPKKTSDSRDVCPCPCQCGSSKYVGAAACYLCSRGVHHVCSSACQRIPAFAGKVRGVRVEHGEIPARRECNGGRPRRG